jgi:hypothetical protein
MRIVAASSMMEILLYSALDLLFWVKVYGLV